MRSMSAPFLSPVVALALAAALSGCATTQQVPVSTDPSGASVYLDGKLACPATPCSVEAEKGKTHLLTITKEGYRQKDIALRPAPAAGGGSQLSPDMITLRLSKPGEVDPRDPDSVVDKAVDMGMKVLGRILEGDGQQAPKEDPWSPPAK